MKAYLKTGEVIDGVHKYDLSSDEGAIVYRKKESGGVENMGFIPEDLLYAIVPDEVELKV